MTHRFPIKEVARQAGVGPATVDRVLNDRAHVSPQTRKRVFQAVEELERQETQLAAKGRRLFVDVLAEVPNRFANEIRVACDAALPLIGEAVYRPRFSMHELLTEDETLNHLDRIMKRGSHGVFLKARDTRAIRAKVDQVFGAGIPVVTLVTDVKQCQRIGYVGLDNQSAGRIAAFFVHRMLVRDDPIVLTSVSQTDFQGELERQTAFHAELERLLPATRFLNVTGGAGLAHETQLRLRAAVQDVPRIDAAYSMGGGNKAILDSLKQENRLPDLFLGHDLDLDNRALLQSGQIDLVLYHNLKEDILNAFRALSQWHGLLTTEFLIQTSDIQVITPYNLPVRDKTVV